MGEVKMGANSEARWKQRGERENNERHALRGMIEGASLPRGPRGTVQPPLTNHRRSYVRLWLRVNAAEYESATELAEAANAALRLPDDCLDDHTHWIWDEAAEAMEGRDG